MANRFWVGNGGSWVSTLHWSTTSGGANGASVPTSSDNAFIDANSFTSALQRISPDNGVANNVDFTGLSQPTLFGGISLNNLTINGNLIANGNVNPTGGMLLTFSGSGASQVTSGGAGNGLNFIISKTGATVQLQDNLSIADSIQLNSGTFDANNFNVAGILGFLTVGSTARTLLMGSGTWTFRRQSGGGIQTIWDIQSTTSLTLTPSTSLLSIGSVGLGFQFNGGGLTYNNMTVAGASALHPLVLDGANTFNVLTLNAGNGITLQSGVTTTASSFVANGSSGSKISIISQTPGSQATISAGTASVSYVAVKDNLAAGAGIPFNDTVGGVNNGNNTNWLFAASSDNSLFFIP